MKKCSRSTGNSREEEKMEMLDSLIVRCDEYLRSPSSYTQDDLVALVGDAFTMCLKVLRDKTGFTFNQAKLRTGIKYADIRSLRNALESCRQQFDHELAVSGASASSMSAVANAKVDIKAEISVSQSISTVWEIPNRLLSVDEKKELTDIVAEMEEEKEPSKLAKIAKAAVDYVLDKSIEAAPKVIPAIAQALQAALGNA